MPARPLRLIVFDRTCTSGYLGLGLSHAWAAGKHLYAALDRVDHARGVATWAEALDWIAEVEPGTPVGEIQFWGHGHWGQVRVADEILDVHSLGIGQPHRARLERVRARLLPGGESLWWFRTCETFGTVLGHDFARGWSRFFGCRAAGHTYSIAVWQSGLHSLRPGAEPHWSVDEGLRDGRRPRVALRSRPGAPNTITCLHGRVPEGY